jgi:hypothetical protein
MKIPTDCPHFWRERHKHYAVGRGPGGKSQGIREIYAWHCEECCMAEADRDAALAVAAARIETTGRVVRRKRKGTA